MNKKTKTLLLAYEIIKGRDLANSFPNSTPKLNRKHSESRHLLFFFFFILIVCIVTSAALVAYGFHFRGLRIYTVMSGILYYLVGVLKRKGSLVVV